MRLLVTLLFAAVATAALFAVVLLGGNTLLAGTPLPHPQDTKIVVAEANVPSALTPTAPANTAAPETATAPEAPAPANAAAAPVAPQAFDKATYTANAANGEKLVGKCKACHTLGSGEPNRVGPNLFGIVGRKVAAHDGFGYSDAMKGKAGELGEWTEDHLFAYLESPKTLVPGTKMAFAGLKDPAERMDLIAYLKTLK